MAKGNSTQESWIWNITTENMLYLKTNGKASQNLYKTGQWISVLLYIGKQENVKLTLV